MRNLTDSEIQYISNHFRGSGKNKLCRDFGFSIKELNELLVWLGLQRPEKFERNCPQCGNIIEHKTSNSCYSSENYKKVCKECNKKNSIIRSTGINNSFFGKSHSESMKKILSIERKGKHFSPATEFQKGHVNKNPITFKESLKNKYGKDSLEYNEKLLAFSKKMSISMTGNKNPMYGKYELKYQEYKNNGI
jgi:hypothetical protein